jgi:hypothetical protein
MQTVVETYAFLRAAAESGMSDTERTAVVDTIAKNTA